MKRSLYVLLVFTIALGCTDASEIDQQSTSSQTITSVHAGSTSASPTLTFAWETDSLLTTVESVLYDPVSGFIYTANIEGDFMEKDGQGSISKINLDGVIVDKNWVEGLDAPTGLSIANGKIYTTDIDRLIEIDIATGKINKRIAIEGAKALNDVTVSPEGVVYLSDTAGNAIYKVEHDRSSLFVENIDTPNGLLYHQNALLVSQWTPEILQLLDESSKTIAKITGGLPQADGVDAFSDHGYLVSSWGGRIFFVNKAGDTTKVLDTEAEGKNAADVALVKEENLLLVATFSKNSITAYSVSYE